MFLDHESAGGGEMLLFLASTALAIKTNTIVSYATHKIHVNNGRTSVIERESSHFYCGWFTIIRATRNFWDPTLQIQCNALRNQVKVGLKNLHMVEKIFACFMTKKHRIGVM